jgi:hypothetical protein
LYQGSGHCKTGKKEEGKGKQGEIEQMDVMGSTSNPLREG